MITDRTSLHPRVNARDKDERESESMTCTTMAESLGC
jgi:hypothetical protein